MAKILIVDDEEAINNLIMMNMKIVGHTCIQSYDGRDALQKINNDKFDLIILDVMLPEISGFELIKHIKDTPVIFLTAKGRLEDKLIGLTSGAEDYITKPFEILELVARVNVILKRNKPAETYFKLDDTVIDFGSLTAEYKGSPVEMMPQEFALMEVLVSNKNLALSREKLLELAWGFSYEGDTRTVDVHIMKLRKKLGLEKRIQTVYKVGYRLVTD